MLPWFIFILALLHRKIGIPFLTKKEIVCFEGTKDFAFLNHMSWKKFNQNVPSLENIKLDQELRL